MMVMLKRFLISDKNKARSAVIWNAFSAIMNSFQTMVLLMVITHCGSMEDSGAFVMAYAVGNLMLNIGKYGVRQFQVTDAYEKYSFHTYLRSRQYTTLLMVIFSVLYVGYNAIFSQYSAKKILIVLLICLMKAIEAYEDVYHGRMQQMGRLDIAGKILGVRLSIFIVGYGVGYIWTRDIILTTLVNVLVTLVLALILNALVQKEFHLYEHDKQGDSVTQLLLECLPLCVCMCLNMYIANAPKYVIDTIVSDDIQTCFNIVFMPVFIIALLANFIFQPCLKHIGELWSYNEHKKFMRYIVVLAAVVIGICFAITFVGALIGVDILGFIYQVDLSSYNNLLIIFMLSGGVIALQNLFIMALTVVRYQKYMIYGYIVIALLMLVTGNHILNDYGIEWLSWGYLITMIILLIYCMALLGVAMKRQSVDIKD